MKKLLFIIFCLFYSVAFGAVNTTLQGNLTVSGISVNSPNPLGIPGLTFYADYTDGYNGVNADFALGNRTATFTAIRNNGTSCHPGTYIDENGLINTQQQINNTPRYNQKIYTENGLIDARGIYIEQRTTNQILYSNNMNQTVWIKDNITVNTEDIVYTPFGNLTNVTISSTSSNGTILQNTTGIAATKTYSLLVKRKSGDGDIYITGDGVNYTKINLSNLNFTRPQLQCTNLASGNKVGIKIEQSGDSIYVCGNQYESNNNATSFIVTEGISQVREAETLRYYNLNNRNINETIGLNFMFFKKPQTGYGSTIIDDDYGRAISTNSTGLISYGNKENATSDVLGTSTNFTNFDMAEYYVSFNSVNSPNETISMFKKSLYGTVKTSSYSNNFTAPDWNSSSVFYVGSNDTSGTQLNGIVKSIKVFNSNLNQTILGYSTKILCIGDSITYGTGSTFSGGYRSYLQDNLYPWTFEFVGEFNDSTMYRGYDFHHSGVVGSTIQDCSTRLNNDLQSYFENGTYINNSKILIHIGTNGPLSEKGANYVGGMVDNITQYNPNIDVFVALIIPENTTNDQNTTIYNNYLNSVLQQKKLTKNNLYIVDMNRAFKNNTNWAIDYMYDGRHPNAAGYKVMASEWARVINATK